MNAPARSSIERGTLRPSAFTRQAELIRTWRPWEKSTGPRSEAGKAVSSISAPRRVSTFISRVITVLQQRVQFVVGR